MGWSFQLNHIYTYKIYMKCDINLWQKIQSDSVRKQSYFSGLSRNLWHKTDHFMFLYYHLFMHIDTFIQHPIFSVLEEQPFVRIGLVRPFAVLQWRARTCSSINLWSYDFIRFWQVTTTHSLSRSVCNHELVHTFTALYCTYVINSLHRLRISWAILCFIL